MELKVTDVARSDAVATVTVHALSAGHFSLPEYQFIHPVSQDSRRTVPSLAFLLQHVNEATGKRTRIIFDLGLRRDPGQYTAPIQKHIETRQPMTTHPDVTYNLANGGLTTADIDFVIYSHVHWDHVGEPRDFPDSTFVVGHGALKLLEGTSNTLRGGHSFFEEDLLPPGRTIELSDPTTSTLAEHEYEGSAGDFNLSGPWVPHGHLPQTLDLFSDGSLLVVNAPGHLPGHVNLLARVSMDHLIYLAGDACHDRRLLTGEKSIGQWYDTQGHICCIHADRDQAEKTIVRIRKLQEQGVEVILAHDDEWQRQNQARFFGTRSPWYK
ncbi:hypothetical protein ACN47E_007340 [Coniothyrium glycines]